MLQLLLLTALLVVSAAELMSVSGEAVRSFEVVPQGACMLSQWVCGNSGVESHWAALVAGAIFLNYSYELVLFSEVSEQGAVTPVLHSSQH